MQNEPRKNSKALLNFKSSSEPIAEISDLDLRHQLLHEIGKCLLSFESVTATFPRILTIIAKTLAIRSAVIIENLGSGSSTIIWKSLELSEDDIQFAITKATKAYDYLLGIKKEDSVYLTEIDHSSLGLITPECEKTSFAAHEFVTLPLVVSREKIFGILQLQASNLLHAHDIGFISTLVNLISVALDRCRCFEKKLLKSQNKIDEYLEAQTLREKFVANLIHDLRTPLTAASISAQIILMKTKEEDQPHLLANKIMKSLDRADRMIKDLLDASQISAGQKLRLELGNVNLLHVTMATIEELSLIHGNRFQVTSTGDMTGIWSGPDLRRIIENLCSNAVKYGCDNSPISIHLKELRDHITLAVTNVGESLNENELSKIFGQFQRIQTAENKNAAGWGIGLTVVRGLAEAHGGQVEVHCEDKHIIFTVTLPKDAGLIDN